MDFSQIPINGTDADYGFIDDSEPLIHIQHSCQPNPSDTDSQYIIAGRTLAHPDDIVDLTIDENDHIPNNNVNRRRNKRKRPCRRNNAYLFTNNNNNNGYYQGHSQIRGFSIYSQQGNNYNLNSLSQPIQHLSRSENVSNQPIPINQPQPEPIPNDQPEPIPNNQPQPIPNNQPAVSLSQPMSNNNNQIRSQPNRFQYFTKLRGLKIRNYFSFKCEHEPVFVDFSLIELLYIKDGDWYIGQGKVMSHMSGINLWIDVFNSDNKYGSYLKRISATIYKNKSNDLINDENCILHGEALIRFQIMGDENNEWDKVYTEIHNAVYVEKLKKDQYMKKYASDREQLAYKLFMSDSNKLNSIYDKIVKDYRIDMETKALADQLQFVNNIINNNPRKYLYLKQFAWLAIQRDHRKIWWFFCEFGETFKSSLMKSLKAILGNLVYLLTTFADMNHICNLLKENPYITTILLDLPKGGSKDITTDVIEQLKNGYQSSTMYNGFNSIGKAMGLAVCSNEHAPTESFTQNRLFEVEICEDGASCYLVITDGQELIDVCPDIPTDEQFLNMTLEQIVRNYNQLNFE